MNTHSTGSLYAAFPPAEARRLAKRLEIHYTPKHGSWLNMAENELAALTTQCLNRRIGSRTPLKREVSAWEAARNADEVHINGRFTIDRAREKLCNVYPHVQK